MSSNLESTWKTLTFTQYEICFIEHTFEKSENNF